MHQKIFSAELDSLYDMLEFIKSSVQSHSMPSTIITRILVATEEALVNIISYGYPDKKKGTIEITCEDSTPKPGIKIVIKDQGIPFNPIENVPAELPSPSSILESAEDSVGGYGIYILIGLMDRVEYQRIDGGNMLTLIKYLPDEKG